MFNTTKHYFTDFPEQLAKFEDALHQESNILITFHQNPDGDAFGSGLGLAFFLKNLGYKNVSVVSPTEYAEYLKWMPGVENILVYGNQKAEQLITDAALIFCLDFSGISRMKEMKDLLLQSSALKIVIDHHENPESFGDLYYWNVKASSTCELIYQLIHDLKKSSAIDNLVATCLYTGLLTDTGSFRFDSTTPQVHKIAAHLLEIGVSPSEIHRQLFDKNPLEKLQFTGYALSEKLTFLKEFRVAYMAISEAELKSFSSRNGDTEGLVNEGLRISQAVMSVLFTEKEGSIRISFRSVHDFSVAELARKYFEGGGHKNAAGGRSSLTLSETVEKFLTLLPEFKEELLKQPN